MKAVFNAKERDLEDWTSLVQKADSRFSIIDIKRLPSSSLALIEVGWFDEP